MQTLALPFQTAALPKFEHCQSSILAPWRGREREREREISDGQSLSFGTMERERDRERAAMLYDYTLQKLSALKNLVVGEGGGIGWE